MFQGKRELNQQHLHAYILLPELQATLYHKFGALRYSFRLQVPIESLNILMHSSNYELEAIKQRAVTLPLVSTPAHSYHTTRAVILTPMFGIYSNVRKHSLSFQLKMKHGSTTF